ncbi:MAG: DNA polymerase IV [Burkholderiales bacterium]|nr:DNA polymerase IV [Burkholderiales bacterium]
MPATPPRLIAHLDMDAFYASVELLRYPELRGKPVVIGGGRRHQPEEAVDPATGRVTRRFATLSGYVGRGVATTATYEARALGLHSAQGLMKAAALAPQAILLPTDFDAYRRYSRLFKAAAASIAPRIEDRGIDEIYIDLTDVRPPGADPWPEVAADDDALPEADGRNSGDAQRERETESDAWWRARDVAKALKAAVREATGLTCSVAVAPNKLIAKIASELDKPDGLTLLRLDDVPTRIWPLPPRRINGIGPKAGAKLDALGITTIGALARAELAWLIDQFGRNYGAWLHEAANGHDQREVVTSSEPRSISREITFERDLSVARDRDELSRIFTDLCRQLAGDLRRKGYAGRTIGVKLRFDNFRTVTRDRTIAAPTQDAQAIRDAATECVKRIALERRIRLLGVRIGTLTPAAGPSEGEHAA